MLYPPLFAALGQEFSVLYLDSVTLSKVVVEPEDLSFRMDTR